MSDQGMRLLARQILWLLWHKRRFLLTFSENLWPQFFGSPEARYLVKIAQEHFHVYGNAPTAAVLERRLESDEEAGRLERENVTVEGVLRLYDHLEPVDKGDFDYVCAEAEEFCRIQRTSLALREALAALDDEGVEAAFDIINGARVALLKPPVRSSALWGDMNEALARIASVELEGGYYSTGLPTLDNRMGGGLKAGELACFIAPTGRGKSMWLCHLAYFGLVQGLDVVYYTFEVDYDEIRLRIMASGMGVCIDDLKEWTTQGRAEMGFVRGHKGKTVGDLLSEFRHRCLLTGAAGKDVLIRDIPPRSATVDGLIADLDNIRMDGRDPKLIIVDYADRMQPRGHFERAHEGQPQIYQDLVSLAKEQDLAIWTAAQGNREALDRRRLTLKHIQGAFAKVFDATFVVAAGQDDAMRHHNYVDFLLAKVRRAKGSETALEIQYDFATTRFRERIRPEKAEEDTSLAMTVVSDYEDEPGEKFGE